jgi:DNA-directed RNA polymerase
MQYPILIPQTLMAKPKVELLRPPTTSDLSLLLEQYLREVMTEQFACEAWRKAIGENRHLRERRLLLPALDHLTKGLKEQRASRGRPSKLLSILNILSAEQVAYTALRSLLNDASREQTQQTTAIRIGEAIELEIRLHQVRTENKELWTDLDRTLRTTPAFRELRALTAKLPDNTNDAFITRFQLGMQLLQLALAHTNLFEVQQPRGNRRSNRIALTSDAQTEVRKSEEQLLRWAPLDYEALIVPPKTWTSLDDGGYHYLPLPLIKSQGRNRYEQKHRSNIKLDDLSSVLGAVSALQSVPWTINTEVLSAMKTLTEGRKGTLKDTLAAYGEQDPGANDVKEPSTDDDTKTTWIEQKILKEVLEPEELDEPFLDFGRVKALAERYKTSEPFYFSWQLDFRGRAYPVGAHLHPQGHDSARSLLHFAEARPLGTTGERWLALHGANMLKADADTTDAKINWIYSQNNNQDILNTAKDPASMVEFWALKDKKLRKTAWGALAFCFEWARLQRDGTQFVSRIPVAMDGTCNAIQHMAALIRDEELARLANIVPSAQRADLYGAVARDVCNSIEAAPSDPRKEFLHSLGVPLETIINRDLCKQPVMTTPYGVTNWGRRGQVQLWKSAEFKKKILALSNGDEQKDTSLRIRKYVAEHVSNVIEERLARGCEIMAWLQKTAAVLVDNGKPPLWTTPIGFPVIQTYLDNKKRRIRTEVGQLQQFRCFNLTLKVPTDKLSRKKAISGIVANFVHSYDSAHMMLTTLAASSQGISGLRMIHDSFACHADQAGLLAKILREQFAAMYADREPLSEFYESCVREMGGRTTALPAPPGVGSLDVNCVRNSEYFFS